MSRFVTYLRGRPLGMASGLLIIFLYIMMIFAEFIAPYSPTMSFGKMTYHPPNLRFRGGKLCAQEARVLNPVNWQYALVKDHFVEVKLFAPGEPYKLWGLIPMRRHLFTTVHSIPSTDPAGPDSGEEFYPVFLMGADNLGRDLFSRIVYGSRISLTIGFIATALSLLLAMLLGGLSGYFGGAADWSVMRIAEFFMLIPGLYLILFLRSLLSTSMDSGQTYMMITLILSLVGWPGSARTIRGMVHAIKREEFILASRLEMIPSWVIIFRHIIPQIASLLIVSVALSVPGFIMTETTLSYLGLGISDPAVSWGSLIKRDISTLANLRSYPWLLSPVWFLLAVTLGFNFLGDCLRDFYDPYHTVFLRVRWPWRKKGNGEQGIGSRESGIGNRSLDSRLPTPDSRLPIPDAPLLAVTNLAVTFTVVRGRVEEQIRAVRGVSFSVEKGEVLGIVGESGSGKSVSVQAVPGLLPKNAAVTGSVRWKGTEIAGLGNEALRAYRGRKIGVIYQEPGRSYDPLQSIGSVFLETYRNSDPGITKEEAFEKAASLLSETGLPRSRERLSNFPHQFSGGQLQRISIALALAQGCELLIADEPTTALDVTIQKQITGLLKQLKEERGLAIIFISHDIDLVADMSGRIIVMYGGLVMEEGGAEDIAAGGAHPYTKALLEASPAFGSHYSQARLRAIPGRVTDPAHPEPGCPFAPRCDAARPECRAAVPPLAALGEDHLVRCVCL